MSVQHIFVAGPNDRLVLRSSHLSDHPWQPTECGTTAASVNCMAWSKSTDQPCPKPAAVVLVGGPVDMSARENVDSVPLCGGHFGVHRNGKPLELAL